jgi:hypothetical protein
MNPTLTERERIAYITGHPVAPLLARLDDNEAQGAKTEAAFEDAYEALPGQSRRRDLVDDIDRLIELMADYIDEVDDRVEGLLLDIKRIAEQLVGDVQDAENILEAAQKTS